MEENKNKNKNLGVRKGAWTTEEDTLLRNCIDKFGEGKWHKVPLRAGLNRCRKSCRLRWLNYLRPNLKRGYFTKDEIDLVQRLHKLLGNRWSLIAGRVPRRTANDVKNFWNTHILKKSKSSSSLAGRKKSEKSDGETCKTLESDEKKSIIYKPRPWNFSKSHEQVKPSLQPSNDDNMKNSTTISTIEELINNNNNNVPSSSLFSQLPLEDNWKNSTTSDEEFLNNINAAVPCPLSEQEVDECIRWWLETEATPAGVNGRPARINQKIIAEFTTLA